MEPWYGIELGADTRESKQVIQKQSQGEVNLFAEKIAQLEQTRSALVAKKNGLERKIAEIEARAKGATREESMRGMERRR